MLRGLSLNAISVQGHDKKIRCVIKPCNIVLEFENPLQIFKKRFRRHRFEFNYDFF
jgi:hypothetical protein